LRTAPRDDGDLALRPARDQDVPAAVALIESAYRGDASRAGWTTEADLLGGRRTDAEAVRAVVGAPGGQLLVATREGRLVGCAQLERRGGDAYFGMFAVAPAAQGGGLGSTILAGAERIAREQWRAATMQMTVIRQRLDLIAWYERRGYARTGATQPFPYGDERFGVPRRDDLEFVVLAKALGGSGGRRRGTGTVVPNAFALDVTKIRADARAKMAEGAVTKDNTSDVQAVIDVLNRVVATEIVCWLRYTQHAIAASGIDRAQVAAEFTEHATDERQHMERAAERISQLGAAPDLSPEGLSKSHTDYVVTDDTDLTKMLEENLVAERIVISTYQEIIRWIGDSDPTTRRLMESILGDEEDHADDLNDLLGN